MVDNFPKDFIWGAGTSSYQIEGAAKEGGKGDSIWDTFSHEEGKVKDGTNGDISCDHYHKFKEDIKIMKEIGLTHYRFSVSWPRIFPKGFGKPNEEGVNFYRELINELIKNNIKPVLTLYHWDLPQSLQDIGGWTNKEVPRYFEEYSRFMFKQFSDIVEIWITHNEPWVVSFVGNFQGKHAPGLKDFKTAIQVSHNILLSHGLAVKAFREGGYKGKIGLSLNLSPVNTKNEFQGSKEIIEDYDNFLNNWFLDPILKGSYPKKIFEFYKEKYSCPNIEQEEMKLINQKIDFLGINYYTPTLIEEVKSPERTSKDADFSNQGCFLLEIKDFSNSRKKVLAKWKKDTEGLRDVIKKINKNFPNLPIYITENGYAYEEQLEKKDELNDKERVSYIKEHLKVVSSLIKEDIPLKGYFVWSLLDNFEWSLGLSKRFGIVYVDFKTQERILKKSALFYKEFLKKVN